MSKEDKVDYCEVVIRHNPMYLEDDDITFRLLEHELKELLAKFSLPIGLRLERFLGKVHSSGEKAK